MTQELNIESVENLLYAMQKTGKNAIIDWTNRTIRILSDVKIDNRVMLSSGPMVYQDIVFGMDFATNSA